jgi:type VII secretion protein EccB
MATRKDQLAAVEFARRRVLGAVLRPDAANPDEAAPRPGRTLFGAAVVAIVALGVAAVVGFMNPKPQDDWRKGLISDGAGTSYVVVGGRLHQVANTTSARLILGPDLKASVQSDKALAPLKRDQGPAVGIPNIPETPPKPADVALRDWSLCATASGRTVVEVGYPAVDSGVLTGASALLAQDDAGQQWVVADGMKFKVLDRPTVVATFNAQAVKPRRVPAQWLAGLATGDPLGVPTISGRFGTYTGHSAPAGLNRVGMFGKSVAADGSPVYYLVSGSGLAAVSPTMYELYRHDPRLASAKFTETQLAPDKVTPDMLATAPETLTWPAEPPKFSAASQDAGSPASSVLCAAFDGSYDQQGRPNVTVSVSPAPPSPLPDDAATVSVLAGHGAIVRESGSDPATATCFLLTDAGIRYQLVGTAATQLGYDGDASVEVPAAWLGMVPTGPALDPAKAAQPVAAAAAVTPARPIQIGSTTP